MPNKLLPEIMKLSVDDRLSLVEQIYESVDEEVMALAERRAAAKKEAARQRRLPKTMLPGQKAELERRIKKYNKRPDLLIPLSKVLEGLKPRR